MDTTGYSRTRAQAGDTFDMLALLAYYDEKLAHVLMEANPEYQDILIFSGGELLRIPIVETGQSSAALPPWRQ